MSDSEITPKPRGIFVRPMIWGTLSGWFLIFVPYVISLALSHGDPQAFFRDGPVWHYTVGLILAMPGLQGLVAGLTFGRGKVTGGDGVRAVIVLWFLDLLGGAVALREGDICLIIAAPLLWAITAIGYVIGRLLARWKGASKASVSLMPLLVIAVVAETLGPLPDAPFAVTDQVTVAAPPEYVWRYVVDYPDNPAPPDYWLWSLGLPYPTHSVAPVQAVGQRRDCRFSGGQAFEERIAVLEPGKRLVFDITKQPQHPEIIGHMTVDRGEIALNRNAGGSTTITATSWYRLHVRPAGYFGWWAEDVTRHVHFRVLGYMKQLAERDYAAAGRMGKL
jgi:uncharacterized protein YndB with AHSA1/START domain